MGLSLKCGVWRVSSGPSLPQRRQLGLSTPSAPNDAALCGGLSLTQLGRLEVEADFVGTVIGSDH